MSRIWLPKITMKACLNLYKRQLHAPRFRPLVIKIHALPKGMADIKPPPTNFWGEGSRLGQGPGHTTYNPSGNPPQKNSILFLNPTKKCCLPHLTSKNTCPCILEGRSSTKPILSAPHLQGPISKLCVCTST